MFLKPTPEILVCNCVTSSVPVFPGDPHVISAVFPTRECRMWHDRKLVHFNRKD